MFLCHLYHISFNTVSIFCTYLIIFVTLHINEFYISTIQQVTHYCPAVNGDVLDTAVHMNGRLSEVIVSDILESDHLPIVFHLLDHVKTRNHWDPVDKLRDWEQFQSLASELVSPRIQINSGEKVDKRPSALLLL
jgi:hypothetical protein